MKKFFILGVIILGLSFGRAQTKINSNLESISLDGELRTRYEYKNNYDFNKTTGDAQSYIYSRIRLGLGLKVNKNYNAYIQIQDSRRFGDEASTASNEKNIDLHQGYFQVNNLYNKKLSIKLGRQELSYGKERLIGAFGWSNIGRSFDSIKFIYKLKKANVDLFAAKLSEKTRTSKDENLFGLVYSKKDDKLKQLIQIYYKQNLSGVKGEKGDTDDLKVWTFALYLDKKINKKFSINLEGAYQTGDYGKDSIDAYALHSEIGYKASSYLFSIEYNYATGDDNSTDGKHKNFDNLYPTNHSKYGYIDLFQWSNLENLRFGIQKNNLKYGILKIDYHIFKLNTIADNWRNAGGASVINPVANSNNDAGEEIDILYKIKINKFLNGLIGYSTFMPGKLVKDNQAADDNTEFIYTQVSLKF